MKIKYGMILAAGLGNRMKPLTLKTPKPLLEINNSTLLERAINLLISHGVPLYLERAYQTGPPHHRVWLRSILQHQGFQMHVVSCPHDTHRQNHTWYFDLHGFRRYFEAKNNAV